MTEKTNKCLCHSFGPLCKVCKAEPCARCKQFTTHDAARLGTAAFEAGGSSAPAQDADFMTLLAARVNPEFGSSLPLLTAFGDAWHAANHKASDKQLPSDLLKELKAARVSYANHRRKGSQGYGFNR